MCAAREQLEAAASKYRKLVEQMANALAEGWVALALDLAENASQFVPQMMRYARKYEGGEFDSIEAITTILEFAPPMLDRDRLDRLERLLKSNRSIDRHATDDLAENLQTAKSNLEFAFKSWKHIEMTSRPPPNTAPNDAKRTKHLIALWLRIGVIREVRDGKEMQYSVAGRLETESNGKCSNCGSHVAAIKQVLLRGGLCPKCRTQTSFVLGPPR